MTTAVQNQNWAPIGNPEGKNLNPWQKLRPAKLAQIPPRDAPAVSPSQGNLAEQTTITKAGTLSVTTYAPRWYSPYAATITNIRASVNTAPTGAAIIVDVLKNGSTIFTTTANRPTIAISGFTATGTPDAVQIAAGDYFQIQIVQVGSTIAGADLTVEITYQTLGVTQATITGLQGPTGATGPGNMATDTLWDAKGDLAVGTGADTAAKLAVGSNTQVLTADSTQSTGIKWASPANVPHKFTRRTAGDYTVNGTNWANLDTGLDLSLSAVTGDIIECTLNCVFGNESPSCFLDVVSIVSAAPVNSFADGAAPNNSFNGVPGWSTQGSAFAGVGSAMMYTLQAGDISSGTCTMRLRVRTGTANNKKIFASGGNAFQWSVKNLGATS